MSNSIFASDCLKSRTAFITGGGTGITFGIARALASHGARVALISRTPEHLEPAADLINSKGGEAIAIAADVRDAAQIKRALDETRARFGGINTVVNGAAGNFLCRAEELSLNGFGTVIDIDLKGTFNVCQSAFADLKQHGGVILNISATLQYLGTPLQIHASSAKAGVDTITKNLAVEWGCYGIRTNGIAPGAVDGTEGIKRLIAAEMKDKITNRIPLRRLASVDDIAHAAVFLCSDAASYINGATLVVDGGQWLAAASLFGE